MGIRTWSIGVVCVASAAFSLTLAGATGSAQQAEPAGSTITIGKVVLGTAPAGTVFVVTYTCEVPDDPASNFSGTLQFNTDDFPMPLYSFTAFYGTHCIVTETDNGGATSVKYTCTENPRGNTCRGAANDFFVGPFDGEAVIGVTNQMTPPPTTNPTATPAVVLQPAFTG